MSETAGQDGAAGQANQNNEQQQNSQGQGSEGADQANSASGALGGAGTNEQSQDQTDTSQDEPEQRQGTLLRLFHNLIRSALVKKVEEVAEHEYLKAEEAIAAVVEWIKEEAKRLGWTISDPAAHAFASTSLLDHKMDAQDHKAVTPPASDPSQETAPPPDHPPPA